MCYKVPISCESGLSKWWINSWNLKQSDWAFPWPGLNMCPPIPITTVRVEVQKTRFNRRHLILQLTLERLLRQAQSYIKEIVE